MIKQMKIQCPRCLERCQLNLSTDATVVVLNCPTCWTPILRHRSGVYVLSEHQMSLLSSEKSSQALMQMLNEMRAEKVDSPTAIDVVDNHKRELVKVPQTVTKPFISQRNQSYITKDDLVNLRIDLATCDDVMDFINRI